MRIARSLYGMPDHRELLDQKSLSLRAASKVPMRYIAFATDYDGTLAAQGSVAEATLRVLDKVKASGRKLILVTGRHLKDLQSVFPRLDLFERVVVENGALLYDPLTREQRVLCEPPPEAFLSLLRQFGVPFEVGRGIVSTWVPHEVAVLDA